MAAAAGLALASAADAEIVHATYNVSIIGLSVGTATAAGAFEPQSYKVDIGVKLTGVAALVSSAKGAATATGTIGRAGLVPASYANTTANSYETRTVRMAMSGGAVRALEVSPPFIDPVGRVPVMESNKHNILDPVSALIMSVPASAPLVGPAACDRTIPIFDGFARYDIALSYVRSQQVQVKGYSGPVAVCAIRYVPVAGHRPSAKSTQFMADNKQMEAWLVPIEHAHAVAPLHVSIMTMAGMLVIEGTEFTIVPTQAAGTN
ncbi:MAG: DUF3108 domain-containing protein [Beijerinckiaceae bacterium]